MYKYKICLIVPYFGKFPNYFQMWLESCRYNPTINWIIYTDDKTEYKYPQNIKVVYVTFEEFKSKIQNKFDFEIKLNSPYKLCDYKPVYGDVFSEELREYDFWGHCDIDLIWGNIRKFVTEDILDNYDKLFSHGHLVLYRNKKEVNEWYKTLPAIEPFTYKKIYTCDDIYGFDEFGGKRSWGGIRKMVTMAGIPQYEKRTFDDIYVKFHNFYSIRLIPETQNLNHRQRLKLPVAYTFDSGKLMQHTLINNTITTSETMYVHFQKRFMACDSKSYGNKFTMIPNKFISGIEISEEFLKKNCSYKLIYPHYFKLKYNNIIRKVKKIIRIK